MFAGLGRGDRADDVDRPGTTVGMMMWRRLDVPGHDACWLREHDQGWALRGAAVFRHATGPACLAYAVDCDPQWVFVRGRVEGFLGPRRIALTIVRRDSAWAVDDAVVDGLAHLVDLDLGFTPATNVTALRRVALADGETASMPAAWLEVETGRLSELPQTYTRRGDAALWYEAPTVGYAALLEQAPSGLIRSYPGLWQAEEETPPGDVRKHT